MVPTFALANAGIEVSGAAVSEAVTSPLGLGVLLGLVVGKPLGIGAAVWAATGAVGRLPDEVTSRMVFGVAALAGVGFTVALFISELAFGQRSDVETAKLAVLLASLLASVLGAVILRSANRFSSTDTSEGSPVEGVEERLCGSSLHRKRSRASATAAAFCLFGEQHPEVRGSF